MIAIIICLVTVWYCAKIFNIGINLWQNLPITEEKSIPVYITKKL